MDASSTHHVLSLAVQQAIAESLGIAQDEITPSMRLRELGDSMDIAQLVLDLEADFTTEITDDELAKLFTVQDVINYLNDPRSHYC
jgi:acyl carrier protein